MRNLSFVCRLATALLLSCLAGAPLAAETFTDRVAPCLACHGDKGQSDTPEVPSLGGQPAPYLLIQLYLFREKQRVVEIMNEATARFTDDDLRTFSEFIATLPPPQPPSDGAEDARLQRGHTLITQHRCNSCHGLDLAGRDSIPRIAAQREDYLVKSLREYKSNARPGYDPAMASVMAPVNDADILDLSFAIARFR